MSVTKFHSAAEWRNCTTLISVVETCRVALEVVKNKRRNCITFISLTGTSWIVVWGRNFFLEEIAFDCELFSLGGLHLVLGGRGRGNTKTLHYLAAVSCWDLGCLSFGVVRKKWRTFTILISLAETCWVVLWGCWGSRWRNCATLTVILETCWVVLWGCRGKMKKLHYLEVSSWDPSCPLRLSEKY